MKKETIRNSNHELMRIISMFLIVLGHTILKGYVLNTSNQNIKTIYLFILFTLIVHVNSYLLLTGYYQSKSTFKQKKIWSIVNANLFYRIVIMIIFLLLNIVSVSKIQLLKDISIFARDYWFISCYIMLYCLSPFLNKLINSLNHKEFKLLIITGGIIFSIIPTITNREFFAMDGYTLYNCIYLYFIGAYLREYPLEKSYLFKRYSKSTYRIILISIFLSCILLNYLFYNYAEQIVSYNSFFEYLSKIIINASLSYNNPIIIIQSIA